jgi:hypothetical protein
MTTRIDISKLYLHRKACEWAEVSGEGGGYAVGVIWTASAKSAPLFEVSLKAFNETVNTLIDFPDEVEAKRKSYSANTTIFVLSNDHDDRVLAISTEGYSYPRYKFGTMRSALGITPIPKAEPASPKTDDATVFGGLSAEAINFLKAAKL